MSVRVAAVLLQTLVLAVGLIVPVALWQPDVSQALDLPDWLEAVTRNDAFAYAAHAGLGAGIDALGGSPRAVAVQWLKAAAHARSEDQIRRAAEGIAAATARSGGSPDVVDRLCGLVDGEPDDAEVSVAMTLAGVRCDGS